jgi:transposase
MENQDMLRIIEMLAKLDAKEEKAEADRKAYQEKAEADRKADRKTEKEELKAAMRSMQSELDEAIQQRIEWIKARTEVM